MAVIRLDPEAPQKTFDIFVNLVEFGHAACIGILLVPRFLSRPVPWCTRKEPAPRQRRLNLAPCWGLPSHPSLRDGLWGWVAETGLERPVYPKVPLRGSENVQTPEPRAEARG